MSFLNGLPRGVVSELLSFHGEKHYQVHGDKLQQVLALRAEWGDQVPRHVEIGAERGDFLEGIARLHPEEQAVGFEWRPKFVAMGNERLAKRGVTNARLVHADAKVAVPLLFPPESLDAVYVLFPDPWWKARHESRRLLEPRFLRTLARRLRPGGRIYLKSDVFDYLYWVRASMEISGALRPIDPHAWPDENAWALSTRERKCRRMAIPYGRIYLERRNDFAPTLPDEPELAADFALPEDIDPIELIKGPALIDKIARLKSQGD